MQSECQVWTQNLRFKKDRLCSAPFSERTFNVMSVHLPTYTYNPLFSLRNTNLTMERWCMWKQEPHIYSHARTHTHTLPCYSLIQIQPQQPVLHGLPSDVVLISPNMPFLSLTESFYRDSFLYTLRLWLSRGHDLHLMQLTGESLFWNQQHCSWLWRYVWDWEEAWT